jgi:hypothetical protein
MVAMADFLINYGMVCFGRLGSNVREGMLFNIHEKNAAGKYLRQRGKLFSTVLVLV